jgi:hypothetical protein
VLVSGSTPGFRSRAQGILAVDCEYQPLDVSPEDCESRSSSDCHMVMLSFKVWMEHLLETICPPTSRQLGLGCEGELLLVMVVTGFWNHFSCVEHF